MSNTQRPTSARKVTKASVKAQQEALDQGVKLTIDGETYEVRLGDVTAKVARDLRRETGHGFNALMAQVATDPDVDLIAEFVWLARRLNGESIALDDVELSYASILGEGFDVDVVNGPEGGDGDPEA